MVLKSNSCTAMQESSFIGILGGFWGWGQNSSQEELFEKDKGRKLQSAEIFRHGAGSDVAGDFLKAWDCTGLLNHCILAQEHLHEEKAFSGTAFNGDWAERLGNDLVSALSQGGWGFTIRQASLHTGATGT